MACEKPCALCPCKPTTPELHRNLVRNMYEEIVKSGGFPCHDKHPTATVLHEEALGADGTFQVTDCAGYKLWGLKLSSEMRWA